MTIGSDQLDAWGKTLIEADELYRELQLLVRINPEGYTVDSDALTAVATANPDGQEDGDLLHPLVFAKHWAWHLASEARAIPPITNTWVPLIRYVTANLHYIDRNTRDDFASELKRLRGLLGALVNENGLAQGEAATQSALQGRSARAQLRAWARSSDDHLSRKDLSTIFPELDKNDWGALRVRKVRSGEDIPARMYPARWIAERGSTFDTTPVNGYQESGEDVYDDWERYVSLDAMIEADLM